jgi:hypothetical protein
MWYRDTVTGWQVWVAYVTPEGTAIGRVTGELSFGLWPVARLVLDK